MLKQKEQVGEEGPELSQQQGFISQKIQIKQSSNTHIRSHSVNVRAHFNRSPFEPKFLPWTGAMKKQPIEAFKVSNYYGSDLQEKSQKKKSKGFMHDHPYKLYASNQNYQLVYCRTKGSPIVNNQYFMNNQVRLHHVGGTNPEGFKKLKDFDIHQNGEVRAGSLTFDSRLECGNLHCVYKNQKYQEYILFIENDTNSLGYNQWFYFSIQNNQANVKYTLRIVNFKKKHSFFKYGAKPAVFSLHEANTKGEGWSKRAKNVIYEQSPIYIQQLPNTKFYSLSFDLTFDHKDDYILVGMSLPYSYSKMINFLKEAELIAQEDPLKTLQFSIKSVCVSLCGNDVPEVTISRKSEEEKKKMIIIMARQHPGEIWSSYMVEGMIRKLVSKPDEETQWLLENYIIKIYPMINIDGVIYGNFRCDITGFDLNRRWKETSKLMHPQVHEIKRKIGLYRSRFKIQCCFDLHGHSKNYNVFCYSCKDNQQSCRLLPLIISKINPAFHFPSCTFGISKYKQTTARAAIYKLIKTENVLTVESSFFGSKIDNIIHEFGPQDIFKMGEDILKASRQFLDKKSKMLQSVKKQIETKINQFLAYDKLHDEDSGSESDPSGDEIDLETKINLIFDKALVDMDDLKGVKHEPSKRNSITIKIEPEQQKLSIQGHECTNKKNELVKPNVAIKEIPLYKNHAQTIDDHQIKQINFSSSEVGRSERLSKKTISYSLQKNEGKDEQTLKPSNPALRERQHKFSGSLHSEIRSERKGFPQKPPIKVRNTQHKREISKLQQSLQDEQLEKTIEKVRKSDQFIKKFERFIPISMAMKNKANVSMFEQSLYNQDQNNLISMLLENKKKIQLQKIKRNVQKSTYLVERQGKIKASHREQKVVDFKSFKQNEKINMQIRKLVSLRYSQQLQ